jgi:hypothetical protein
LSENLKEEPTWEIRCRWEDNIKMNLEDIGCEGVVWIEVKHDV